MKILYGIQGTGNGHITRARHMAAAFAATPNIQVDYFFSGREKHKFFDMEIFNHYASKQGLTFASENGRINHCKTLVQNNVFSFIKDIRNMNVKSYDLILNDFEPISAWAAKKQGVPSLSLSHQAAFLNNVPTKQQTFLDRMITQYFAPTKFTLGTHWYHFGHSIIPPFVNNELLQLSKQTKSTTLSNKHILVYLPFESPAIIKEECQVLSDWQFICYHPDITHSFKDANIQWNSLSQQKFKDDLFHCSGVISNCGFELSTECLSLGKPLLVKPLQGQYEQISNAYTLEKLGLCEVINSINAEQIDDWLQIKNGVRIEYPSNCTALVNWITQGNWHETRKICHTLWQDVKFPIQLKHKLDKLFQANI